MNVSLVFLLLAGTAIAWATDAQTAPEILRSQGCLQCHNVHGPGTREFPKAGPDLAERLMIADYTVPALAATLWNHTPTMWSEMSATVTKQTAPSEAEWGNIFRYLYALQFSDRPARARQGSKVFEVTCAKCHGVGTNNPGPGKPVPEWARLEDPIALVYQMWNHASSMKKEFASRGSWKKLSARDLLDLTVHLQSVQKVPQNEQASLPTPEEGRGLTAQHCGKCHGGSDSFAAMVRNKTLMDIGAATWNHVPLMETMPVVSSDDFRKIVAYAWELQYRGPEGVASRGEQVFDNKGCISCHRSPGGKQTAINPRPGKTFTPYSMVALSWGSGREMHRQMQEKGVRWPRLSPEDVANLVAYLNTLGR